MMKPNRIMPRSFNRDGTEVIHTYQSVKKLASGDKIVDFFQDGAFPYEQNVGTTPSILPNNIGFDVYAIAIQVIVPTGKTVAGLNEVLSSFLSNSILRFFLAEDNYCEFSGSEFLPSVVANLDTGATNAVLSTGPINAMVEIDLSSNPIPIGPQTTFKPQIISGNAITSAGEDIQIKCMLKGEKYKQTTAGARRGS